MGKKYNMSKIIRLDWQMLILNMSVYIVYKRFSWALILDSVEHLCFFYEIDPGRGGIDMNMKFLLLSEP